MSKKNAYDAQQHPRVLKKYRGGVRLTHGEIREIREGRKALRRDMRRQGIRSYQEFEATASSLGLYFDKGRFLAFWLWLWHRGALGALLAAAALGLAAMYAFSVVTEMRGHFTINLAHELVSEGFELSNTADFANPTARIYGTPVEDAPCISIADLPDDVDDIDGSHNGHNYFAHTFYIAKRGEGVTGYDFSLSINSESLDTSDAIWVMLFEDGVPTIYAKANGQSGEAECLPPVDNNRYGYKKVPFLERGLAEEQFSVVAQRAGRTYYRLIPRPYQNQKIVAERIRENVKQDEVHKYTVVIWLEGDDPDCTNDLIGAHIGLQMDFNLWDRLTEVSGPHFR